MKQPKTALQCAMKPWGTCVNNSHARYMARISNLSRAWLTKTQLPSQRSSWLMLKRYLKCHVSMSKKSANLAQLSQLTFSRNRLKVLHLYPATVCMKKQTLTSLTATHPTSKRRRKKRSGPWWHTSTVRPRRNATWVAAPLQPTEEVAILRDAAPWWPHLSTSQMRMNASSTLIHLVRWTRSFVRLFLSLPERRELLRMLLKNLCITSHTRQVTSSIVLMRKSTMAISASERQSIISTPCSKSGWF